MSNAESTILNLSFWQGDVVLDPLSGGLSNESFVATHAGKKYVARYGLDIPCHHVIRSREQEMSRAAAELGISPRLVHCEHAVMIFDFIEGKTYGAEDLPRDLENVVALIRKCHDELHTLLRGPGYLFWVFHVLRDYAQALRDGNSRQLAVLPRLMRIAERLERDAGEPLIRACHSDLLAANFINDGERLWLIDWEYGGFGNVWFDLGNVCAISDFSREHESRLLQLYFDREPTEADWRSLDAMRCAAHLREAMWAMVSEIYMTLEIDYETYTAEQQALFDAAWRRYTERYGDD